MKFLTTAGGEHLRRLSGFTLLPFISLVTPLLALPVVARFASTQEWSSIAIGQSVGTMAGLLVAYGYTLTGPARVAGADADSRRSIYLESLEVRAVAFAVALCPGLLTSFALAPNGTGGLAAVMCLAMMLGGFSAVWYSVGCGTPSMILYFEVLPRVAATVGAAALIAVTGQLLIYPVCVAASNLMGMAALSRHILGSTPRRRLHARLGLRRNLSPALSEVVASAYSAGALALVSLTATAEAVSEYASGDRIYRVALISVVVVSSTAQPWVSQVHGASFRRRALSVLGIHVGLGVLGLLGMALLAPGIATFLFTQRLSFDATTGLAFGLAFLAVSVNTSTGRHVLASRGHTRAILTSTIAGAAVGVPAILLLAESAGAPGAALGLAFSEVVVVAWQAPQVLRLLRRNRSRTRSRGPGR